MSTVPAPRRHALGMPAGSIRALLGLSVLASLWVMAVANPKEVPALFVYLTILKLFILVHYFASHGKTQGLAVSHKHAMNGQRGKNMVGSYYPPRLVAIDVDVLRTLPPRLVRDGLAEAIKHALAQANSAIVDAGRAQPEGRRMGTTAVCALQRGKHVGSEGLCASLHEECGVGTCSHR